MGPGTCHSETDIVKLSGLWYTIAISCSACCSKNSTMHLYWRVFKTRTGGFTIPTYCCGRKIGRNHARSESGVLASFTNGFFGCISYGADSCVPGDVF